MTGLEIWDFVTDYIAPVAFTIALALLIYVEARVAIESHRKTKREQQIH